MSLDYTDPFLTFVPGDATPLELQQTLERHALLDDFLLGRVSAETMLDCVAEHGGDPIAYVDDVEQAIAFITHHGLHPENAATLLNQWDGRRWV